MTSGTLWSLFSFGVGLAATGASVVYPNSNLYLLCIGVAAALLPVVAFLLRKLFKMRVTVIGGTHANPSNYDGPKSTSFDLGDDSHLSMTGFSAIGVDRVAKLGRRSIADVTDTVHRARGEDSNAHGKSNRKHKAGLLGGVRLPWSK